MKNAGKEQEKFFFVYCILIGVVILTFWGVYPCLEIIFFFFGSFVVFVLGSFILEKAENSDLIFFILFSLFVFISYLNLMYKNYVFFWVVGVLFFISWYKQSFIPKIHKDSNFSNFSNAQKFFIDFAIIEFHFKEEFSLFNIIRKVNIVAGLLLVRIIILLLSYEDGVYSFEFHECSSFLVAAFFTIIVNSVLIVWVRYIIITKCNPKIIFTTLQKCVGCTALFMGSSAVFLGFHVVATTPIFEPVPIPPSYWYQEKVLGFKYYEGCDGAIGKIYKGTFKMTPPLKGDGFIDVDASLKDFSTLSKEKLEFLFSGVPHHFKPNFVGLTGVPNEVIVIKSPHGPNKFEK